MPKKISPIAVSSYISQEFIERRIYQIRGLKVMLDRDLAELYAVPTKQLNRQVQRHIERFPQDFMFQLTMEEFQRCQIGTFGTRRAGSWKYLPYVFTQEGVAMLSGILNSPQAVHANIKIMRTFIHLREWALTRKDLQQKIEELESKYKEHDKRFDSVFEAIRRLLEPPVNPNKTRIGFHA